MTLRVGSFAAGGEVSSAPIRPGQRMARRNKVETKRMVFLVGAIVLLLEDSAVRDGRHDAWRYYIIITFTQEDGSGKSFRGFRRYQANRANRTGLDEFFDMVYNSSVCGGFPQGADVIIVVTIVLVRGLREGR